GEIGYLHIRAMDAPSLRQFQLDLAANRTKKALIIDQRFNGGGGIDQELLGILSGRQYQYTKGRDAGFQQPRPQNFYGPVVVMQNERSASDAEMFPAGFKALGLGKVIGVPTMAAVIGTGSYTLLDGSTIRTPGSGVWTMSGENMENYGVPPDVYVDNTPEDFLKGRDAQIEKAIEVLKGGLTDTVEVRSQAPLLNTTISTLGQVIENRYMTALPNIGRNPLTFLNLTPGVNGAAGTVTPTNTNFVANGTRNSTSDVLVDGA